MAATLLLLLAACGGDDETSTDTTEPAASEPAASDMATDEPSDMASDMASDEASDMASDEASPSEGTSEGTEAASAMQVSTECAVDLPADGPGSAEGMAEEPVATAASNNPELSMLVAAVDAAGLTDTLNNAEAATVFAPSNAAFEKVPADQLQAVMADPALLTTILTYHVHTTDQVDAQGLAEAGTLTTVEGEDLTFSVDESTGQLLVDEDAAVVCPDVVTANATVHIIDTVLMPPSMAGASSTGSESASEASSEG